MSRVAKSPIPIPDGVTVEIDGGTVKVKGAQGLLVHELHPAVRAVQEGRELKLAPNVDTTEAVAQAGTARALLNNMVTGVHQGFERKLTLVGVGYRAQLNDSRLNLSLGFSHPIEYRAPDGITIETPSLTEIVVKGIDKQKVGQVAAVIRGYRPPEPYKGKGIRYANEEVVRKEAKKK